MPERFPYPVGCRNSLPWYVGISKLIEEIMKTTVLIDQAKGFLQAFLESSEMDYDYLVKDMNEVFDTYEWQCKADLPDVEKARWTALLRIGMEDGLSQLEANEFFKNTDPEGQHHIALQHYLAKRWLRKLES